MDKRLRELMKNRQDARAGLVASHSEIISYVARFLGNKPIGGAEHAQLREAYIIGHLADHMSTEQDYDPNSYAATDAFVQHVLEKKGFLARGNSDDRRSREEERAYGNAREAWSYILKEAGLR